MPLCGICPNKFYASLKWRSRPRPPYQFKPCWMFWHCDTTAMLVANNLWSNLNKRANQSFFNRNISKQHVANIWLQSFKTSINQVKIISQSQTLKSFHITLSKKNCDMNAYWKSIIVGQIWTKPSAKKYPAKSPRMSASFMLTQLKACWGISGNSISAKICLVLSRIT